MLNATQCIARVLEVIAETEDGRMRLSEDQASKVERVGIAGVYAQLAMAQALLSISKSIDELPHYSEELDGLICEIGGIAVALENIKKALP